MRLINSIAPITLLQDEQDGPSAQALHQLPRECGEIGAGTSAIAGTAADAVGDEPVGSAVDTKATPIHNPARERRRQAARGAGLARLHGHHAIIARLGWRSNRLLVP